MSGLLWIKCPRLSMQCSLEMIITLDVALFKSFVKVSYCGLRKPETFGALIMSASDIGVLGLGYMGAYHLFNEAIILVVSHV